MTDHNDIPGMVIEALPGVSFRVTLENKKTILAKLSGKMMQNHIRVLPGDRVRVVLSPDGRLGRIVRRV